LPGIDRKVAEALTETAHHLCPFSNATRGNIEVVLNIVTGGPAHPVEAAQHV
jgi:organic hydroperoxide reductase OsmC/OhrA